MPFVKKSDWTPEKIEEMIQAGRSMVEIGEHFGISRQRVKQICQKHGLTNTVQRKQELRASRYFKKWGAAREKTDLYDACRDKFRRKKAQAKRQGAEWRLHFGELEWPKVCPILGLELDYFAETTQENSPSFDRVDPAKGYVAGNVLVVSWRANRIKNDGTADEHRLIAEFLDRSHRGL